MEQYKQEFIEFMIDCNVLKFGDFTTKSGRKTPFFVNTGFYRTGAQLRKLGQYYAKADWILMCCLDRHIKEFLFLWQQPWKSVKCTERISVTVPTVRK